MTGVHDQLARVLASLRYHRRRMVVSALLDRDRAITIDELVHYTRGSVTPGQAGAVERCNRRARIEVTHVLLPKLVDTGLVEWNADAGSVTVGDHPALDEPAIRALVRADTPQCDALIDTLVHPRRRHALGVIQASPGTVGTRQVARRIHHAESETGRPTSQGGSVDTIAVALHHRHLPKLAAVNLVRYDHERGTVMYRRDGVGMAPLDRTWLEEVATIELESLSSRSTTHEVASDVNDRVRRGR